MKKSFITYLHIISIFVIMFLLSSCDSNVTDSNSNISTSKLSNDTNIERIENPQIMSNSQAIGEAEIVISNTGNPAGSGSVKVTYENESVTVYYSSSWSPVDVASTLNYNINNDPDIDLTSSLSYGTGTITITGYGTSSVAYVTHTNGTHITATPYHAILD